MNLTEKNIFFVYKNSDLIYKNKEIDSFMINNLVKGAESVGEDFISDSLEKIEINEMNIFVKRQNDLKFIFINTELSDINEIIKKYEKNKNF